MLLIPSSAIYVRKLQALMTRALSATHVNAKTIPRRGPRANRIPRSSTPKRAGRVPAGALVSQHPADDSVPVQADDDRYLAEAACRAIEPDVARLDEQVRAVEAELYAAAGIPAPAAVPAIVDRGREGRARQAVGSDEELAGVVVELDDVLVVVPARAAHAVDAETPRPGLCHRQTQLEIRVAVPDLRVPAVEATELVARPEVAVAAGEPNAEHAADRVPAEGNVGVPAGALHVAQRIPGRHRGAGVEPDVEAADLTERRGNDAGGRRGLKVDGVDAGDRHRIDAIVVERIDLVHRHGVDARKRDVARGFLG